jgi:tetratricopeptide (TPR) repeat protein
MKRFVLFLILCGLFNPVLPCSGKESTEKLYDTAVEHYKNGNYDEAIQLYTKVADLLGSDKKNVCVVLFSRARAFYGKGDFKSAFKDVSSVMNECGEDGETQARCLNLKGMIRRKQGNERSAIEQFTESIKIRHSDEKLRAASFTQRGISFLNLSEMNRAASDFTKAIDLDPMSALAYAGRSLSYLRSDKMESAALDRIQALKLAGEENKDEIVRLLKELDTPSNGACSVTVPISDAGHVFVQVRFGKQGKPHRFLLDTGATVSLIDKNLLNEIRYNGNLRDAGKSIVRIADGSQHQVSRYVVKNAYVYDIPLGEIELQVFDKPNAATINLLGVKSLKKITLSLDHSAGKAEIKCKKE